MAKVTNAYSSYNGATSNREDLSDVISNISPTDSPLLTAIGKGNAANRLFEWQTESLATPDVNNAMEEGFVAVAQAYTSPARQGNVTQILSKNATVTGTQEEVKTAGKNSELGWVMALRSKELKRDLETILCTNQARVDGNDSGTARRTRGFEHFLTSNVSAGTGYAAPASATAAMTDGTLRNITETMFLDTMQAVWSSGGEADLAIMGGAVKRKVSAFAGRTGTQVPVGKDTLAQSVDLYISDFGTVKLMASRFCRARTVLIIDPSMAKVRYLRPFTSMDLAKTGDADVKLLLVEAGLEVTNEAAHGKVADVQ